MELSRVIRKSLEDYRGNWKRCLVIGLYGNILGMIGSWIYLFISFTRIPFITYILGPLFSIFTIGISYSYLIIARKEEKLLSESFGIGFKDSSKVFKISFFKFLFTALWSLLFFIPGTVKSLGYSQANYMYLENQEFESREYLKQSSNLMKNKKKYLFLLDFLLVMPGLIGVFILLNMFGAKNFTAIIILTPLTISYIYMIIPSIFIAPLYGLITANFYSFLVDEWSEDMGKVKNKWNVLLVMALIAISIVFFVFYIMS